MQETIVYFRKYFPHLTEKDIALRLESIEKYEKERTAFIRAIIEKNGYEVGISYKRHKKNASLKRGRSK